MALGFGAIFSKVANSKEAKVEMWCLNQRGRARIVVPLILLVVILVLVLLRESGTFNQLGISLGFLSKPQSANISNNQHSFFPVKEHLSESTLVDDDDDIEDDEIVKRDDNGTRSGSPSTVGGAPASDGGSGPISKVIRPQDQSLSDEIASGVNAVDGDSQNGLNISDVFSSLEDEDDAITASGRIFGVRVQSGLGTGGGVGGSGAVSGTPGATPDPNETPRPWVTGQSRGYTMLYAMHPRARDVVESQVSTLLRARVREPHIGVLIDGTFTRDFEYLKSVIDRLSQDGRRVRLTLYLTNGPVMRRFDATRVVAPFSKIDPERFRILIRNDNSIRDQFLGIVNDAARIFRYNLEAHPENSNIAVVMLEDNLDFDSYNRMRLIASRTLNRVAIIARNPCIGCYSGNDGNPQGDVLEEHNLAYFNTLNRGDAYSFDGTGFSFPGQQSKGSEISSDQLLEILTLSVRKGLQYVGLWRAPWQGIVEGQDLSPPEERTFTPSTKEEQLFEIAALRHGLSEEVPPVENPTDDEIDLESDS